jgi:hypothetical protein
MAEYVEAVNGQCGTCKRALRFEHGPSTPVPENRVRCTSEAHARYCCEQTGYDVVLDFFKKNGYVLLLSLEVLTEEGYVCPHWEPRDSDVGGQSLPADDAEQVTM